MRVFADTSGLFAALVRNDINHPQAKATLALLLDSGAELHATSYHLLELLALLQARVSFEAARSFDRDFRPLLRVIWVDEALHTRAFHRLELRARRSLSLVDCAAFVVMEELGITDAFGYDPDFEQEGFRLVGGPKQVTG